MWQSSVKTQKILSTNIFLKSVHGPSRHLTLCSDLKGTNYTRWSDTQEPHFPCLAAPPPCSPLMWSYLSALCKWTAGVSGWLLEDAVWLYLALVPKPLAHLVRRMILSMLTCLCCVYRDCCCLRYKQTNLHYTLHRAFRTLVSVGTLYYACAIFP